jgi:hypothetical protein
MIVAVFGALAVIHLLKSPILGHGLETMNPKGAVDRFVVHANACMAERFRDDRTSPVG